MEFNPTEHQHIRWNPMKGEWVLVSPHRMKRPWSGQVEKPDEKEIPEFDEKNPLCPGVTRPCGIQNPNYETTFVFDNDFPALLENVPSPKESNDPLFKCKEALGKCRVMCFHPKSNVTIPTMKLDEVLNIVKQWIQEYSQLSEKYTWVQIFENKGSIMGCSNPHPHCQIWTSSFMPNEALIKDRNFKIYFNDKKSPMLLDYAKKELDKNERIVCSNNDWIALVPYWATWPYETMLLLKENHRPKMSDLSLSEQESLADIMQKITIKYDNLFEINFPYSMGFHGAPTGPEFNTKDQSHWQFHAVYYPPLLRSASVKKFMVGYEMLANPQRDLTAEQAATKLKNLSDIHYKNK